MKKRLIVGLIVAVSLFGQGFAGFWLSKNLTGLTTTVQTVSSAPGGFGGIDIDNTMNAASTCIQVFDTTGTVTLGTTTPTLTFTAPASAAANYKAPDRGDALKSGLKVAAATTCTGSSAPASAVNVNVHYH